MNRFEWSKLNHLQLGRYAEYFVKMEFTSAGFDVYTSEVDDRGIDFVIRKDESIYYDVQVKSVRGLDYIFFQKDKFKPRIYLIPSTVWLNLNNLFVSKDYLGKKSKPEWGLNLSKMNLPLLEQYEFDKVAQEL